MPVIAAYYTAAAQRETHERKYDFYYSKQHVFSNGRDADQEPAVHCVNCSVFFSAFLKADWLSEANKSRLLEWKVW